MKVAILVREETLQRCTGKGCLAAFFQKKDAFARYEAEADLELAAFTHAGGDLAHKIEMLRSNGVDVVHLSSCLRSRAANYEELVNFLGQHFDVVGYTHGGENGKEQQTVNMIKGLCVSDHPNEK
ncbi:MAG TPA: CGGC domain-containing protein [Patescibacteria group bacterium]|nr:CGGC domain-containing protein [Patescibacteria group bacterium]